MSTFDCGCDLRTRSPVPPAGCGAPSSEASPKPSNIARWLLVAAVLALSACTTNPITGRSQLMMVSEESAIKGAASAYSSMIETLQKKRKVEHGTPRVERVKDITNRLIAEAVRFRPDSATWGWEVQVIDDPKTVNAFCMAGGKMGIYTGFWEKLHATDDEVAQVMGHEIGHALASHTREKMSVGIATGAGVLVLSAIVASQNRNDPTLFSTSHNALATAAALAVTLPNSREAESEADQIGIELAARAGFDPAAAVTLWNKMAAEGGPRPLEFLSTHPAPENRAQRLEALAARVQPLYRLAKAGKPTGEIPVFVSVREVDAPSPGAVRQAYAAQAAAQAETLTFVSEDFERFKRGDTVLTCTFECAFGYAFQKRRWKELHGKQSWRDLAVAVIRVGYYNDLSYFLLGEAASGLGLHDAAKYYYARARAAQKEGKTCGGTFDTCEGFEMARLGEAGMQK